MQSMHVPVASQKVPVPQAVPKGWFVCVGTPPTQESAVQALLSSGVSRSSMTVMVFPAPSHSASWQSPAVCIWRGVSAGVYTSSQALLLQAPCLHSSSGHGNMQSDATLHSPQMPLPSQTMVPSDEHEVPAGA